MMTETMTVTKNMGGAPRTGKADVTLMIKLSKELSAALVNETIETGLTKTEIIRRMLKKRYETSMHEEKN
jgi:hypothetical protein